MKKPKISIIAINWWAKEFSDLLVESINKNISNKDYEIIIVDNSNDPILLGDFNKNLLVCKSDNNLGHGGGLDLAIQEAKGDYILALDIDSHILAKDWDLKILAEYHKHKSTKLIAADGGALKPIRPLFMFFEKKTITDNKLSFKAVNLDGVKFDVSIHAYFRILTKYGDRSVLKLPYKKTDFKDVLGNEYSLNGERFVYHNWYATRWYNINGQRVHDQIDRVNWEDFVIRKDNLFKQINL